MSADHGVTYWLAEEERQLELSIEQHTEDIERLEARIVAARAKRDDLRLVAVEMRAARNLIEAAGLRVERRGTDVHVSVERTFADVAP